MATATRTTTVWRGGKTPRTDEQWRAGFWAKVDKSGDCWEWTACLHSWGYGITSRPERGSPRDYAHRVSYEWEYGPIPDGLLVLHHCDNPPCVRPSHLFLGTQADNLADMSRKGRGRKARVQ